MVRIFAQIVTALLVIWTLCIAFSSLSGITIYFPFIISPDGVIPIHRQETVRTAVMLTFAHYGVLGNENSRVDESFENGLLEYPQYTKPQIWEEKAVPEVLLSGDHSKIKDWRLSQSEAITRVRRPDLWEKYKKN